jgi:5-formyltetrahydrofolate cyclo-ligase
MMRHIREKKMLHNQQQSNRQQLPNEPQMLPEVRPPDLSQELPQQVQKQQAQHSFVMHKMNKESLFRFVVYWCLYKSKMYKV